MDWQDKILEHFANDLKHLTYDQMQDELEDVSNEIEDMEAHLTEMASDDDCYHDEIDLLECQIDEKESWREALAIKLGKLDNAN